MSEEQIKEITENRDELEADLLEFATAIESACLDFKRKIAERHGVFDEEAPAVLEANFDLNYTEYASQKLGTFEVAENNYSFSYWLYNGKIYRQKLKR
jgi:hypothetical protein